MFFDRFAAKKAFEKNISKINKEWIIIAGNRGIGKTAFAKEITNNDCTLYCKSTNELLYWRIFFNEIKNNSEEILNKYKSIYPSVKTIFDEKSIFMSELAETDYQNILEELLKNEICQQKTELSKVIGKFLKENIKYIVFDDLYLCDYKSYEWLVSLSEAFISDVNFVIVICDLDLHWQSNNVKCVFKNTLISIDISHFDNEKAYYDLLRSNIYFDNSTKLKYIAKNLFEDFNGDSHLILTLVDVVNTRINPKSTEEEKEKCIYQVAGTLLYDVKKMDSLQKNILALLSLSPIPLNLNLINKILDQGRKYIRNSLDILIDKNLVDIYIDPLTSETVYKCGRTLSKKVCKNLISEPICFYYQNKIYALYKEEKLTLSDSQMIELILTLKPEDLCEKILKYFKENNESIDDENKARLINVILNNTDFLPKSLINTKTIDLLYAFGYYSSAKKIFERVNNLSDYNLLMKYGDTLHLTLDPKTAFIYEKAAKIGNISVSERISAINRQIMAMTQKTKKDLLNARVLYQNTIKKYSSINCHGMVELYRNANNIYEYNDAMKYTILGYHMACSIKDHLEKLKCLHNICMLELLNGTYNSDLIPNGLDFKPHFEDVYEMLLEYPNFSHETAYPLLDMANNEMFKYDENDDECHLNLAKSFFSEAQLYSKSFYAKNIAEMGLLIVNSYLYPESQNLRELRNRQFSNYLKSQSSIQDFRVHRKKLFSFATSAKITNDFEEAKKYLLLSKKYVFEGEILRFNNLCKDLNISTETIPTSDIGIKLTTSYHKTTKFVPWLISFGH